MKKKKIFSSARCYAPFCRKSYRKYKKACKDTDTQFFRVIRDSEKIDYNDVKYFDSIGSAAEYAEKESGNILITTGSKNLAEYTGIRNFSERLVVRVLPDSRIINSCIEMGFKKKI